MPSVNLDRVSKMHHCYLAAEFCWNGVMFTLVKVVNMLINRCTKHVNRQKLQK